MISVLVVADRGEDLSELAGGDPSVEVLLAQGAEEAVEKLARNRRIDAVLLIPGKETEEIVSAIREDNPAPPPLFMGATELPPPDGVRRLSEREPGRLITLVAASLES